MLHYFSVFDKKAASYFPPFAVKHVSEARRSVQMLMEEPNSKSPVVRWPGDYALYHVGTFDETDGTMLPPATHNPQFVEEIAAFVPQKGKIDA